MAAPDDYLTILHVDDGKQWAIFLSARLNGPNYGIKTVLKNLNSVPCNDKLRPSSTNRQTSPNKDHNLDDSGRGSRSMYEVDCGSDLTDNARAIVFLLSPDMLSSEIFPVDVSTLNPRRSVFLFLGVEIEDVRKYFGQDHSYVFNSHCCIVQTDERSINDAMVQIIVAFEDQGENCLEDEYDNKEEIYKTPRETRQLNRIEKVLTQEIYGTDRDVYFLLERQAEETLHVTLETGDQLDITCVCDRLYKFTLPVAASGEVVFKVACRHYVIDEDSVLVLTKLDKLKSLLNEVVNPLSAIAAALGLNSDDVDSIDDALALRMQQLAPLKTFQEMFPCEDALNNSLTEDRADVAYPSLLHFAADMNLQKFCSELLRYPGMLSAAMTENKDGDDPSTLAFKKGYTQLESALIQFVADHKTTDDSEYVQPLAPKPHAPGKVPGYVNLPQPACENTEYFPMDALKDLQKPYLDSGSQRSDVGSEYSGSHISENVFFEQSFLTDIDDSDQFSIGSLEISQRSNTICSTTPRKALKMLGVREEDINRPKTTTLTKQSPRSDDPVSKPLGMIPHGVRFPGVSQIPVELGSNCDNSAVYGDSKHKVNKIAAFFGKIKSKRSSSEGENVYITGRAIKKSQSARGDKLKKKCNEESSQERDSGSYSDDENGQKISDVAKRSNKPGEFREREKALVCTLETHSLSSLGTVERRRRIRGEDVTDAVRNSAYCIVKISCGRFSSRPHCVDCL